MKRLEQGEGCSPAVTIRLREETTERLEELVKKMPPHPAAGPVPRAMVLRAVIDAGIEAVAKRERVKLMSVAKTGPSKARRASRAVHPNSRSRAEKRAAERLAAGCKCGNSHVRTCKLYNRQSSAA